MRTPHLRQRGATEWRGACPIHHGKNDSFAVEPATGQWFCHSTCSRGGSIIELEMAFAGPDFRTAKAEVWRIIGRADPVNRHAARPRIVATYDYTDETGRLLYQVVRMDPKGFSQRRPNGKGGWLWNIKGVRLILYHLPELLKRSSEVVFICEG